MQYIIFLFVVSCISDMAFALRNAYSSCRTRDTCIRFTECQPYMNLLGSLKRPLSSAAVMFLRRQECGFDGSFPMVCCFPTEIVNSENKWTKLTIKEDQPKQPQKEESHTSTSRSTTTITTEKVTSTTRLSRRREAAVWNLYDSAKSSMQQPKKDDKNKREDDLKRKIEALNNAFAYTAEDYFFVRRMLGSDS